jgi:hypothetical protein
MHDPRQMLFRWQRPSDDPQIAAGVSPGQVLTDSADPWREERYRNS